IPGAGAARTEAKRIVELARTKRSPAFGAVNFGKVLSPGGLVRKMIFAFRAILQGKIAARLPRDSMCPIFRSMNVDGTPMDSVGLCARCQHARTVKTPRSVFWRCELSKTDSRFPRHPRLPVLECPGFDPQPEDRPPSEPEAS